LEIDLIQGSAHMNSPSFFGLFTYPASLLLISFSLNAQAQDRADISNNIDARYDEHQAIALKIWDLAELGYLETESSGLLQQKLVEQGFKVKSGVAGIPTSFVAEAGSGKPVIAFLAEFDALPGITQTASPVREEIAGKAGGQACGHHLFGTASLGAAVAVQQYLKDNRMPGTIRVYGTPAEEGGSGKVYMVRAGLFDDVDAVLSWHPSSTNRASASASLANRSARFNFRGVSAHAAGAPEKARSALDGVEAFNYMTNLMREHVPQETRIHYVITSGGEAPNVVPDYAQVYYYVRHPDPDKVREIWQRVEAAAQGAAAGTGTTVDIEIMHGNLSLLPNRVIADRMQANLEVLGGYTYSAEEQAFAEEIFPTLNTPEFGLGSEAEIQEMEVELGMGSTDVGDVSWKVPTAEFTTATWVPGTPAHSWQAIAAGGTSIGIKGMQLAAKTLAYTAVDLYENPELVKQAQAELQAAQGENYEYQPLLGDRQPALDYRLKQ
jgi:aminobenzoyl-glutamate utilization protein B